VHHSTSLKIARTLIGAQSTPVPYFRGKFTAGDFSEDVGHALRNRFVTCGSQPRETVNRIVISRAEQRATKSLRHRLIT
jgi:hypothetical protein